MSFSNIVLLFFGYRLFVLFGNASNSSNVLDSVFTELLPLAPFLDGEYILEYEHYLDSRRLASIPIDWQHSFMYDSRYEVSSITAAGVSLVRWAHWGGRGTALSIDCVAVLLDTPFILCTKATVCVVVGDDYGLLCRPS